LSLPLLVLLLLLIAFCFLLIAYCRHRAAGCWELELLELEMKMACSSST
jgi:hypothetical protein